MVDVMLASQCEVVLNFLRWNNCCEPAPRVSSRRRAPPSPAAARSTRVTHHRLSTSGCWYLPQHKHCYIRMQSVNSVVGSEVWAA